MTSLLKCRVRARIPTQHAGNVFLHLYQPNDPQEYHKEPHLAIVFGDHRISRSLNSTWSDAETDVDRKIRGASKLMESFECDDTRLEQNVLVRVHSACFTGETIGSTRCDCAYQLMHAMEMMAEHPDGGVIIYLRQEGRGIGLEDKLKAYNLQDMGHDTVSANKVLHHPADARTYDVAADILRDFGISKVRLVTNNPDKLEQLSQLGIDVIERVPTEAHVHHPDFMRSEMAAYLLTKITQMSDDASSSDYDIEEQSIRQHLASVPFGELARIKNKVGLKEFNRDFRQIKNQKSQDQQQQQQPSEPSQPRKRASKHQPMEMSTKKPVSRFRQVIEVPKIKSRDPRFDPLCGRLDTNVFESRYAFINDVRKEELKQMKEKMEKTKNVDEKAKLLKEYNKLMAQESLRERENKLKNVKRQWKKQELERVKQGKKPYFLKDGDVKTLALVEKYKELEAKGKPESIDKLLEKRRKRNATKMHPRIPMQRRTE